MTTTTGYALTEAQAGIWRAQLDDPGNPAYNTAEYVEIHGPVDAQRFEQALCVVVSAAEALRATFDRDPNGVPAQNLHPLSQAPLHVKNLEQVNDPVATALGWMRADVATPMSLDRGPLFRTALIRTGSAETLWYFCAHSVLLDAYGFALISRRVSEVYSALMSGTRIGACRFGGLAGLLAEEAAYRSSKDFAADRQFFMRRLRGRRPGSAAAAPAPTFWRRSSVLSVSATRRFAELARGFRASWPEAMFGLVAIYVHHLTGAGEVVVKLPMMSRLGSVAAWTPAMVTNVLPLRVTPRPRDTVGELVRAVVSELRKLRRHQRYRYENIRADLGSGHLVGPTVSVKPFSSELDFAGYAATQHFLSAGPVDDFTITMYQRGHDEVLPLEFDANPRLYAEHELSEHARRFTDFAERVSAALPACEIGQVALDDGDPATASRCCDTEPIQAPRHPNLDPAWHAPAADVLKDVVS